MYSPPPPPPSVLVVVVLDTRSLARGIFFIKKYFFFVFNKENSDVEVRFLTITQEKKEVTVSLSMDYYAF